MLDIQIPPGWRASGTTVSQRTCPIGASEGGNEGGGGSDAMAVEGAGVTVKLL